MRWLQSNRQSKSPKTTGRRITSLRAYAKWAGWGNILVDYSAPTPAQPTPHPLPEGTDGVFKLLEVASSEKQRALVALCGLCGLRVAEALAVRPSHFDVQEMTLLVRGKGDRSRVVPVSEAAWNVLCAPVLRAQMEGDRCLVQLKDRFARRTITELGMRARLARPISSHDLRATFATDTYHVEKDLVATQRLLGHASSKTTEGYTGVSMDAMRRMVER
jgi:site-specific recombinase XerD